MIIWISCDCDKCKKAIEILHKNINCKIYSDGEFIDLLQGGHLSYFTENPIPIERKSN